VNARIWKALANDAVSKTAVKADFTTADDELLKSKETAFIWQEEK
jgi:hypothetical protein